MAKLFLNINELKQFISVTKAYEIKEFETRVDFSIEFYLKKWIGEAQLNALISAHATSSLTTPQAELVKKLQMSLAHFVFYEHIPFAQVIIDDSGISRKENDNYKTAYANQVQLLMNKSLKTAYDSLEHALNFLEDNQSNYPLWVASSGYTQNKKYFINTAVDFGNQYPIIRGRLTFKSMFPTMDDVETFYIEQCLGNLFYTELKTKILNKTPFSQKEKILIGYIKKAIANLTISRAVKNGWVKYTTNGVINIEHSASSNVQIEKTATNNQESLKIRETQENGDLYLSRIKDYLYDNINDFPTFKNDTTVNPIDPNSDCDDQTDSSDIFFV